MEAVLHFLKKYVGRFGIFNLVLLTLENILDDNFVCPCKHVYNIALCVLYGFVPALGCVCCTLCFVDLSPHRETEVVVHFSRCINQRQLYSGLTVPIWLSICLFDGRYLACALSDWGGVYTKSDTLDNVNWCKPPGNEPSVLKSYQKTLELIFLSQIIGFILMTVIIIITATYNAQPNTPSAQSQPNTPSAQSQPNTPSAQSQPNTPSAQSQPNTPSAQSQPNTPTPAQIQPNTPSVQSQGAEGLEMTEVVTL
ncbi:uncharacterized protein LOC128317597 [Pangasianodon hypophthalmus]|uniref:uncharacterized protein LOC128317597 n=1 Tax=Pangasianodon hypophthalmus TaxID=310915 RepID=UPI00230831C1|nr:uncharacterized protein LOC128317597 [Pangasianodon hypophthalmus]